MLKKFTLILTIVLLSTTLSKAQWTNLGAWPDTSATWRAQCHSVTIDPDGKIWAGKYANVANFTPPGATQPLKKSVYLTYVFNPDGTQAPFSPIFQVMGDTMYGTSQRGMRTNIDGNILLTIGATSPNGSMLFLIDYKTGIGLKKVMLGPVSAGAGTAACVSSNGTIFVAPVSPGAFPLAMYDQNLTLIGNAIATTKGFSRSFEVSKDGNTIYWAGYDLGKVYVYNRQDEFSDFTLKDSILIGAKSESFTWQPKTGYLWIGGGSNNDKPSPPFTMGSYYAYDVVNKKIVDSLRFAFKDPTKPDERPRGLAFSADGNTAYAAQFGTSNFMLQKFVKSSTGVKQIDQIPTGYVLSQNYPNPFNPTTNIQFSIPEQGFVSLKVYNTLGQEVATLVNDIKSAGTYKVDFDASKLSSGVYIYTLSTGRILMSKKMLLMK